MTLKWVSLWMFQYLGDSTPSPNSYTLPTLLGSKIPNKKSSASHSMTARAMTGGFAEDLAHTPGPGNYLTSDPNIYKRKAPGYSMLGRSYMPGGISKLDFLYTLQTPTYLLSWMQRACFHDRGSFSGLSNGGYRVKTDQFIRPAYPQYTPYIA